MKLIQTENYLLLIDEESRGIEFGEIGINMRHSKLEPETRNMGGYGSDKYYWSHKKCLAYRPLTKEAKELDLPLLTNPFEEDITKLAIQDLDDGEEGISNIDIKNWIKGYKAAQSKQFSLEDMKKAIEMAREIKDNGDIFDIDSIRGLTEVCTYDWEERYSEEEIIQSLSTQQLPKEFVPVLESYCKCRERGYKCGSLKPETDAYCIQKLKTITNSEGKDEIQGTYKY